MGPIADEPEPGDGEQDSDDASSIAPLDFNLLVLSLNTSALIQLGEPDSEGRSSVNLPMARHTIDMLCVLEEKTRGNLTGEEERILHQVLFDLRLRFARAAKAS